jgi:regulation of enolase protein 1 (concanavalin A-like superfamily)
MSSGLFSVDGAGADIWNGTDAFRFVYQRLSGDGTIVARVTGVQAVASWTKAAVMIRESLSPGSPNAAMLVSAAKGLSFQRRLTAGASTTATLSPGAAPAWVRLTRSGTTITAYRSGDGSAWTLVDKTTISMARDVLVGLAVSSHVYGRLANATFTNVSVTGVGEEIASTGLRTLDIGAVGVAGSAALDEDGSLVVRGAGADIWGASDAFRYVYAQAAGDWDIEARIEHLDPVHAWTKAGVMIRETLQPQSRHAFAFVSAAKGIAFQYRSGTGGMSSQAAVTPGGAPHWVKLSRRGSVLSAFHRADGATAWQPLGTITTTMGSSVYVGIGITSHDATRAASVTVSGFRSSTP